MPPHDAKLDLPGMTEEEQVAVMTRLRHVFDAANAGPLDRKHIIVFLAANFIVTTNEIWGGDRAKAMQMIDNFATNVRIVANHMIDCGGMRVDGFDCESLQ
jgi:hypothetical protein